MICGHDLGDDDICAQAYGHEANDVPHMRYAAGGVYWDRRRGLEKSLGYGSPIAALLSHPAVSALATAFSANDHELYLVGGSVRDLYSGHVSDDLDFATDARPDETEAILGALGPTWSAGKSFGTIGVMIFDQKVEVTTYRADTYDRESRKPEVAFSDNLEDDLARRDFTINAMALDTLTGELIDPHGGRDDLEDDLIATPLDPCITIMDDPLRALRAIRFAATRDVILDYDLMSAIAGARDSLGIVSQERKTAELMKIAAHGIPALNKAIRLAAELGITEHLFGSLVVDEVDAHAADPLVALAFIAARTDNIEAALFIMKFPTADAKRVGHIVTLVDWMSMASPDRLVARWQVRRCPDDVLNPALDILRVRFGIVLPEMENARGDRDACRAPLPVDGNDFLASGFVGKEIGRALRCAEWMFLGERAWTKEELVTECTAFARSKMSDA